MEGVLFHGVSVLFVLGLIAGVALALLGFAGTVVILLDAILYSALRDWRIPWWVLLVLFGAMVLAETGDNLVTALGTRRYGASKGGMVAAFAAGIVGAFVFGAVLGPPLGLAGLVLMPLAGGLLGGFAGAYLLERRRGRSHREARRAGLGAVLGRLAGAFLKTILAVAMAVLAVAYAF